MKKLKQYQFWICLMVGLGLLVGTYPYDHDRYIPEILTALCICLNMFSSILFSTFLYCSWTNRIDASSRTVFLLLTIMQVIVHGIFIVMNWGSFLFLPLSVIVFIILLLSHFRDKKK